jgi:hypothetical protein
MRTKESIKKLIEDKRNTVKKEYYSDDKLFDRAKKEATKEIEFYKTCILYLESNPSEDFLNKQLSSVGSRITSIDREFDVAKSFAKNKEHFLKTKTKFYKDRDIDKLKTQINYLNFILDL